VKGFNLLLVKEAES